MALDAGDIKYSPGQAITLTGDGSVSEGKAVTFDGSGNLTHTTANGDDVVGVAQTVHDDDEVTAVIAGLVVMVELEGSANAGDTLIPSGTTDGAFAAHADGTFITDTTSEDAAVNHPFALEDGTDGDVIAAVFR